jgi:hypothetical protein
LQISSSLEANRLLAQTDKPIFLISEGPKFEEATNFTKFFKRETAPSDQVSPSIQQITADCALGQAIRWNSASPRRGELRTCIPRQESSPGFPEQELTCDQQPVHKYGPQADLPMKHWRT